MAAQLLTWAVTLGTVRLLTPADYGLSGLAMSLASILTTIVDLGLLPAIPAMPTQRRRVLAHAFGLLLAVSVVMSLLTAALARPIAHLLRHDELAALIPLAALLIFLEGVRAVPSAVASRDFRFTLIAKSDFVRAIIQSLTTFSLAWSGAGPWSILGGAVAGAAASLPSIVRGARLMPRFPDWSTLRPMLGYARLLLMSRISWQAWANADTFAIGRFVSTSAVGSYNVAGTFAFLPMEKLLSVLFGVITPYFAERSENVASLRQYFLELTELVSLVAGLPLIGLALVAPEALPLVIGTQWTETIPLLRLLIPGAFLGTLGVLSNQLVNTRGRARVTSSASTAAAIAAVPCYAMGAQWGGVYGVAGMTLVVLGIVYLPGIRTAIRETQTPIGAYALAFRPFMFACVSMAVTVHTVRWALSEPVSGHQVPALLTAAALIGSGAIAALGTVWLSGGPGVARLREIATERMARQRQEIATISS
jgi:PST family polysaccharide transporter